MSLLVILWIVMEVAAIVICTRFGDTSSEWACRMAVIIGVVFMFGLAVFGGLNLRD